MILFFEVPDQTFVGTFEPGWFQSIILAYVILNVASGFYCLLISDPAKITTPVIIGITITDLAFLTALMITSGGVESGLDSLLIFAAAFGGVMIHGQISYLFPSSALILSFSAATYTLLTDVEENTQHFFEVAMLGIAAFAVNALLQYVADLLKKQEMEVVSLSTLERMRELAEQSRRELEEQYDRFNVLLISTSEGVLGLNRTGNIIFANPRACELLAAKQADLINQSVQEFMLKSEDSNEVPEIFQYLAVEPAAKYDPEQWRTNLGEPFLIDIKSEETFNKAGEPTGAVILFKNVTEERAKEEKLQYLANHDALTGLPNRAHFNDILGSAITRNERTDRVIAIMIVDLDHFTVINERLGQQTGDEILKEMANRLTGAVRPGDLVARMGGDQFAVMLVDLDLAENASLVAEKIIREISSPLNMDPEKGPLVISTSIGIAVTGQDASATDELLAKAVSAVESAKAEGRNQ